MRTQQIDTTAQFNQVLIGHNPHALKDHDYDDELEFHMSEASEEGTADDYDSQAEVPTVGPSFGE